MRGFGRFEKLKSKIFIRIRDVITIAGTADLAIEFFYLCFFEKPFV